jgi:hypothetical protein
MNLDTGQECSSDPCIGCHDEELITNEVYYLVYTYEVYYVVQMLSPAWWRRWAAGEIQQWLIDHS